MSEWLNSKRGQSLLEEAFKMGGLPEVKEDDLATGIYTNQQIAEKCETATQLIIKIESLSAYSNLATKRAILSFWVDRF